MAGEGDEENPRFFIAVHVGAGYHAPSNEKVLRAAMKRACLAAASVLRKGPGVCIDAVSAAIQVLEDDPNINAGRGSNLTEYGHVECDASVMDGDSGAFGAVGAVPGVQNPIQIATCLAKDQLMGPSLLGRIPPIDLHEDLYMAPLGIHDKTGEICGLQKFLHGLEQALRVWFEKFLIFQFLGYDAVCISARVLVTKLR